MGDGNSNWGASKSLNFEIQLGNSQNHSFRGTLCYGLDATKFRPKFRLRPKIVLCFQFLLERNRKHRNWFQFPLKEKGISAERKILAENVGFLCSLVTSTHAMSGQVRSSQDRFGQDRSSLVQSTKARSSKDKCLWDTLLCEVGWVFKLITFIYEVQ